MSKVTQNGQQLTGSALAPGDLLTPQELAKRLKVPLSWIYKHTDCSRANGNRLPVLRCDGFLRFDWNAVCEWMRSVKS